MRTINPGAPARPAPISRPQQAHPTITPGGEPILPPPPPRFDGRPSSPGTPVPRAQTPPPPVQQQPAGSRPEPLGRTAPNKTAPLQRKKRRTPDTDPTVSMISSDYLPGPDMDLGDEGPRPASVDLPPSRSAGQPPSHTATVVYDEPGLPDLLAIRIDAPDEPPDEPEERGSVAFPLGVAMIVTGLGLLFLGGAAAVVVGIYWATSQGTAVAPPTPELPIPITAPVDPIPPIPGPAPAQVAPTKPVPAAPVPAAPAPAPAAVKPAPTTAPAPAPAVKPVPAAAPVPVPVIVIPDPEPAPEPSAEPATTVEPAPEPETVTAPPEPTPDTPARLVVTGGVLVELEGDYGGFREGTPLPPGAYSVRADFGAGLVDTGLRTIATPGGTVSVKCAEGACTVSP